MSRRLVKLPGRGADPEDIRVLWVKDFTEDDTQRFARELAMIRLHKQRICPIIIDSPGGDAYSLLAMMDLLASYEGIVATIAIGKAMSCGAALFTCGHKGYRYIAPHATLMLHDVSEEGGGGKTEEVRTNARETVRMNEVVWKRMAKNIGKPVNYLTDQLKARNRTDWYVTAREAVKLGLASYVGIPVFEIKLRVDPLLGVRGGDDD